MRLTACLLALATALGAPAAHAAKPQYQPFVLASTTDASVEAAAAATRSALEDAGFAWVGQYRPVPESLVMVFTRDDLLKAAAATERGGYAAAQRVSVTRTDEGTEVAFVNPQYLQHAYRVGAELDGVRGDLVRALGQDHDCGADGEKMTADKLADYHYMVGMPRFDEPYELGAYPSHEAAVAAVEAGLARPDDGLTEVYRIDIPGKAQTVFGVGMRATGEADEDIDEGRQMAVVDFEGCRKTAYFPYEVLVDGGDVEALHMRFRMAVHFPDLSMMGKHGFTKLMPFPGAIEDALKAMLAGVDAP